MKPCHDIDYVLHKLDWMREEGIWPNGLRYLWTDAFGVVLLASLATELKDDRYLDQAKQLVDDVYHVLSRKRGIRIGEAANRDGQYFHYLAMWMYALSGVSLGLQAIGKSPQRVEQINRFFEAWRSRDEYDREAITHVMACTSHFPGLMLLSGV